MKQPVYLGNNSLFFFKSSFRPECHPEVISAFFNLSSIWGHEITLMALAFTDSFIISLLVSETEYNECNNYTSHNRPSLAFKLLLQIVITKQGVFFSSSTFR